MPSTAAQLRWQTQCSAATRCPARRTVIMGRTAASPCRPCALPLCSPLLCTTFPSRPFFWKRRPPSSIRRTRILLLALSRHVLTLLRFLTLPPPRLFASSLTCSRFPAYDTRVLGNREFYWRKDF